MSDTHIEPCVTADQLQQTDVVRLLFLVVFIHVSDQHQQQAGIQTSITGTIIHGLAIIVYMYRFHFYNIFIKQKSHKVTVIKKKKKTLSP